MPGASVRTMMSSVPPAAAGTTTRTGRVGNASAPAANANAGAPNNATAAASAATRGRSSLIKRAAHLRQVFLLDPLGVELRGTLAQGLQHFLQRRQVSLDPGQRVDPRHDESPQVRAREAASFEFVYGSCDQLVELEDVLG